MILRSKIDWAGREINGIILGEPAIDETTGDYVWDHLGLPGDLIDDEGDIYAEVEA